MRTGDVVYLRNSKATYKYIAPSECDENVLLRSMDGRVVEVPTFCIRTTNTVENLASEAVDDFDDIFGDCVEWYDLLSLLHALITAAIEEATDADLR